VASIPDLKLKSKTWLDSRLPSAGPALWLVAVVLSSNLLAFGLGRLSLSSARQPITIELPSAAVADTAADPRSSLTNNLNIVKNESGEVVASRQGSKYHYPWCSGAKRIKPENLISFPSAAAARAAGLTPAANCPGLE